MRSSATSVGEYLKQAAPAKQPALAELRDTILKNLPPGFEEIISYGMIGYAVPHNIFPQGYHCDPAQPLPFINLAAQKNFIALYHMGLYGSPSLLKWFQEKWSQTTTAKLVMGKSCIRFKKAEDIPYELIGELCSKVTVEEYVKQYTSLLLKSRSEPGAKTTKDST